MLPIRYDRSDRSRIAIDEPALEAIADETRAKAREIKQEKAGRQIAAGTKSGVGIRARRHRRSSAKLSSTSFTPQEHFPTRTTKPS